MLDKLPNEILASELVQYCDKDDAFNLTLTCRTVHRATVEHVEKRFRPPANLINMDNPIFFDQNFGSFKYNTCYLKKSSSCGTKNYYTIPGSYVPSYKRTNLLKSAAKL